MTREKLINSSVNVSGSLVGLVFIFSGFVKGIDPMGSAYKFSDYFNAFNLGFLEPMAVWLSFVLSAAEYLIGISLVFRFRFRLGAWAVTIFMGFFTVLTFILALTNPVTDCGCFGDAILMTNWQTFIKNLILLPFVIVVFYFRNEREETWPPPFAWGGLLAFLILILAVEFNAFRHLPMVDFRPYSIGTYIPDKMSIPDGAPQDIYETVLYYEKNGQIEEFTEDNFPWEDTTWKFVDTKSILVSKGYEPPIHDFTISDESGFDITRDILNDGGYNLLMISTHMGRADRNSLNYAHELAAWCQSRGHSFYFMTSSGEGEISEAVGEMGLSFRFYTTDEITLKTIVRSNPGMLLLKEGTILGKWHYNDFPPISEFEKGMMSATLSSYGKALERRDLGIFIAIFLIVSLLIVCTYFSRKSGS